MANPNRGEVDLDINGRHLTLKFTNRGQRECEAFLEAQGVALARKIDQGIGAELKTGLFLGATRKFHAMDFPTIPSIDNFMDEFDDAKFDTEDPDLARDMELELQAALLAAFFRDDKKRIKRILMGPDGEEEAPPVEVEEDSEGEVPKAEEKEEAPAKPKRARSRSGAGTSS